MSAISRNPNDQKTRTVSSNEAKQHWGAMMKAASEGEDVIVEWHGKPKAVVISPEAFEELREARERQRREEAIRLLNEIESTYDDLTEEEVEGIAVQAGREINRAVAERLIERSRQTE